MAITTFVKSFTTGTLHGEFEGRVGCLIEIVRPVRVTHLGRIVGPGFTSKDHGVRLCREGTNVAVCSAVVNTGGGTVGQMKYSELLQGPTLVTPGRYDLVSDEETGGNYDPWYNSDTVLNSHGGAAQVLGASFYAGFDPGDDYHLDRGGGHSFGPVDFKYDPVETAELVTGYAAGTNNAAYAGWQGLIFQTLGKRLRVTALGRLGLVGNNQSHAVRLVDHVSSTLLASATVDLTGGVSEEGFFYTDLAAPVTLEAWNTYCLWSQETTGGDSRYVVINVTSSTLLGSEVGVIVGAAAGTDGLTPTDGIALGSKASGPTSLRCEVLDAPAYLLATPESAGQVALEWGSAEYASSYRVERSTSPLSGFLPPATYARGATSARVQLTGSGKKYFRVVPVLEDGAEGPPSPVAEVRVRPTLTREPQRSVSGLLLRETFADRLGETSGLWSVVASPSLVSFAPSTVVAAESRGDAYDGGARQGQVIQLRDGRWLGHYDGAVPGGSMVSDADRRDWATPRYQVSVDKGLTWQRYGPTDIFSREEDDYGETVGRAMGHVGVFAGRWVATLLKSAAGDEALLTGPFYGDQFESDSPFGPWRFVGMVSPVGGGAGSFDDETNYGSCVVKSGSVYYLILAQFKTSPSFVATVSLATSSSPAGPWTVPTSALSGTVGHVENPKVFYHSGLARWVMLTNVIRDDLERTDKNRMFLSASLTDWSAATYVDFQHLCPLDAHDSIGVASPVYKEEGEAVVDSDGTVPFVYDANPQDGNHYFRRVYYGQLEMSKNALQFNDTSSTVSSWPFELEHSEFVAEFAVEIVSSTAGGFVAFDFLMDTAGANGYRAKLAAGGVLSLVKVTAGVESTVQAGSGTNATTNTSHRLKIVCKDRLAALYLDGEMQAAGAVGGAGVRCAFTAKNINCRVRLPSLYRAGAVTLRGLAAGAQVVLRGAGGVPLAALTADPSGVAVMAHGHFPVKSVEVDGHEFSIDGGAWGGDEFD